MTDYNPYNNIPVGVGDKLGMSIVVSTKPTFGMFTSNTTVIENVTDPPSEDAMRLPEQYVGLVGRLDFPLMDDGKSLCFVGPDGSGRRSLSIAIATVNGRAHKVISYNSFHDKYVGETERRINDTIATNKRAGILTIFTDIPKPTNDGALSSIVNNVINALKKHNKGDVWVVDSEFRITTFQRIDLSHGTLQQLMDWSFYYFRDPTIGIELSHLRLLPVHFTGISPRLERQRILERIYAKLLSNDLVKRDGELTVRDWHTLLSSRLGQLRECVRKRVWEARNGPGYLFHGAPGSGKTHTYHVLIGGASVRHGTSVGAMEEAKQLYQIYGLEAPLYIVLLDEFEQLVSETHPDSMRDRILGIFGSERDSPRNLIVIATTNKPLERISAAVWRRQRLEPIELTYATPEEMEIYAPGFPYMEKIQFVSIVELSKVRVEERVPLFLRSLDLPYIERSKTDDEIRQLIPEDFIDKALKIRQTTRDGCTGVYVIDVRQRGLLAQCFDVIKEGYECITRLRAYRLIEQQPLCLVVIRQEEIPTVDYIPRNCCVVAVKVQLLEL